MATVTATLAERAVSATLSGTTADTIQIAGYPYVEIVNRDIANDVWVSLDAAGVPTPAEGTKGSHLVRAGGCLLVENPCYRPDGTVPTGTVGIVIKGNGGKYAAAGLNDDDVRRSGMASTAASGSVTTTGAAASGSPVSGNPVLVAGSDGTNARTVKTDASGNQLAGIVDVGTAGANVVSGDAGNNGLVIANGRKEVSFTTNTAQAVASTDVSNYTWAAVHITSQGTSSTVTFQGSNDNTNWTAVAMQGIASLAASGLSATTGTGIFHGPIPFRYFRLNVTGISAGTTTGVVEFKTQQSPPLTSGVFAQGNATDGGAIGTQQPIRIGGTDGTNIRTPRAAADNADGLAVTSTAEVLRANAETLLFNNTSWDRRRGNVDTAALITASGATTTQTSADQTNYNGRGVKVVLDMTSIGTGSVTIAIQGKDAASGKYYAILTGAAVVTNSTNVYTIYPGATVAANASASDVLPRVWRVVVTANNANATTYTVGASVIV